MSAHHQRQAISEQGGQYRSPRANLAGVTLIELIITLTIATILMTLAIPSFQGMVRTNRIAVLTNELSSALQFARSEAITRGQTVTLCESDDVFDDTPSCNPASGKDWHLGWLVFVDDDNDGVLDTGETLLLVGQPGIEAATILTNSSAFSNKVVFSSDGQSKGSGTIAICIEPEERDLVINFAGRLRLGEEEDKGKCP